MKRREIVSTLLWGIGGAIISPGVLLSACNSKPAKKESFTSDDIALLDEVGETIIPATASSPGAKAAKIGEFMKVYVTDCYNKDDQDIFYKGLTNLRELSN